MVDLTNLIPLQSTQTTVEAQNSTNKKAGTDLDMSDFLTLMVAMFQNQSIDNQADTSEMMNMMVQMSVVEAISNISTLINDSTVMTYAASLVGKNVTIGQYIGKDLYTTEGVVQGTGSYGGQQVVFVNDKSYYLSDIMAVGQIPSQTTAPEEGSESENGTETPSITDNPVDTEADTETSTEAESASGTESGVEAGAGTEGV